MDLVASPLDIRQRLDAIKFWQSDDMLHPLTCGVNSDHELLEGRMDGDNVVLVCPECGYVQNFVPDVVNVHYMENACQ